MQQLDGYVEDVNRIMEMKGAKRGYRLEDRYEPDKAISMFEIVQGYYNPRRNLRDAAGIHADGVGKYKRDPRSSDWYWDKIKQRIRYVYQKEQEEVGRALQTLQQAGEEISTQNEERVS